MVDKANIISYYNLYENNTPPTDLDEVEIENINKNNDIDVYYQEITDNYRELRSKYYIRTTRCILIVLVIVIIIVLFILYILNT